MKPVLIGVGALAILLSLIFGIFWHMTEADKNNMFPADYSWSWMIDGFVCLVGLIVGAGAIAYAWMKKEE